MIKIRGIKKSFGSLEVLKGIDLDIERGKVISIVGSSGAGKTTLLQIMGTLDEADSGSVIIDGVDVMKLNDAQRSAFRNKHMGFVFQFHQLLPEFTALENVMMPALIGGVPKRTARQRAEELLGFMGLKDRSSHKLAPATFGRRETKSCCCKSSCLQAGCGFCRRAQRVARYAEQTGTAPPFLRSARQDGADLRDCYARRATGNSCRLQDFHEGRTHYGYY